MSGSTAADSIIPGGGKNKPSAFWGEGGEVYGGRGQELMGQQKHAAG